MLRFYRSLRESSALIPLIVVLLALGALAGVAQIAAVFSVQHTLEAVATNGSLIASSDTSATDEEIAAAVEAEIADTATTTISVSGATVTVLLSNRGIVASGSVSFVNREAVVASAVIGRKGLSPNVPSGSPKTTVAQAWSLVVTSDYNDETDLNADNYTYSPERKFLTYTTMQDCLYAQNFAILDSSTLEQVVAIEDVSGTSFTTREQIVATRSATSGTPCTFTVDLAALESARQTSYSDSAIQKLIFVFHNGAGYAQTARLVPG